MCDFNEDITYLVTGAAGFIGYYLSKRLLELGKRVIGVDNLNSYYDVNLKKYRLVELLNFKNFSFLLGDIADKNFILEVFKNNRPQVVINLAAQAGVRYSIENPDAYIDSNIRGFFNILEGCRFYPVKHLLYASSSSVYGRNEKLPFEETDFVDRPVSLYAATKKSNELMAHCYSTIFQIPATGLRFFTVYGPAGRPDMAYYGFANKYFADEPIEVFNSDAEKGDLFRDFTYIDDIVEGILKLIKRPPNGNIPYRIFNIGNSNPVKLMDFINALETAFSTTLKRSVVFKKIYKPIVSGDVRGTYASTQLLEEEIDYKPSTSITSGLINFAEWYVSYHKVK